MRILLFALICLFLATNGAGSNGTRAGFFVRGNVTLDEGSTVTISGQGVSDNGAAQGNITVEVLGYDKRFTGRVTSLAVIKDATQGEVEAVGDYAGQSASLTLKLSSHGRWKCVNSLCVMQGGQVALRASGRQQVKVLHLYDGGKR